MKKALITGITGQDGAYLADYLLKRGYKVFGLFRRTSTPNFWRLYSLDIFNRVNLISGDLDDAGSLSEALNISDPDEVYHLAAQSFVEASFESPYSTGVITGLSTTSLLEAIRHHNSDIKFYFAGTSEMFGDYGNDGKSLDERSSFMPMSPYAAAKLYGFWITKIYRKGYGIFASCGLLFNHESPLRGLEFVTRKIANEVSKVAYGISNEIRLGNLDSRRDWGYAPEYVEAMWKMLQTDEPQDYVIATGEAHSVKEFLELAAEIAGIDWEKYTVVDERFKRPLDVPALIGNPIKARNELDWSPRTGFDDLVKIMVNEEMKRWKMYLEGDRFPWDVPNYQDENSILKTRVRM